LQCISSYSGVLYLKKKFPNLEYFIKIRSDFIINNLNKFLISSENSFKKNNLISIGFAKYYFFYWKSDIYIRDYIVGGNYHEITQFFMPDFADEFAGKPNPERWLQTRYFGKANYVKIHIRYLIKNSFFIRFNGFDLKSLKHNINFNDNIINGIYYDGPSKKEEYFYIMKIPFYILKKILSKIN
jgi:hypothetical protein